MRGYGGAVLTQEGGALQPSSMIPGAHLTQTLIYEEFQRRVAILGQTVGDPARPQHPTERG